MKVFKNTRLKAWLDWLPFGILVVCAVNLIWTVATTDIALSLRHYVALGLLPIVGVIFSWHHKLGLLCLGLLLFLGTVGLLSLSPAIATSSWMFGSGSDNQVTFFYCQPIFLLWLVIHFFLSGRQYVGILTRDYWRNLINRPLEIHSFSFEESVIYEKDGRE